MSMKNPVTPAGIEPAIFRFVAQQFSVSMIHDHTQTHRHSVGILWTSDRPVAEASTCQYTTLTKTNIQVIINYTCLFIRQTFLIGRRLPVIFTFPYQISASWFWQPCGGIILDPSIPLKVETLFTFEMSETSYDTVSYPRRTEIFCLILRYDESIGKGKLRFEPGI